jgi:hypothetical protein
VAIEVPLSTLVAVSVVYHDEVMLTPGANQSTHAPRLDQLGRESLASVAPIVMAAGTRAGVYLQASFELFPAATA